MGRGLKNTRPLNKATPLLPRQRRSWGLAFVTRIRTPDPRISSSSFEERTQLRHLSWFRDPHCAFLISDPVRRLSQVNLLHDRARGANNGGPARKPVDPEAWFLFRTSSTLLPTIIAHFCSFCVKWCSDLHWRHGPRSGHSRGGLGHTVWSSQ